MRKLALATITLALLALSAPALGLAQGAPPPAESSTAGMPVGSTPPAGRSACGKRAASIWRRSASLAAGAGT